MYDYVHLNCDVHLHDTAHAVRVAERDGDALWETLCPESRGQAAALSSRA